MTKRTIYLPDDLAHAIKKEAAWRGTSEAEVIRDAVRRLVDSPSAESLGGPIFNDDILLADQVDEILAEGFGAQ
jgi:hypothetical protein